MLVLTGWVSFLVLVSIFFDKSSVLRITPVESFFSFPPYRRSFKDCFSWACTAKPPNKNIIRIKFFITIKGRKQIVRTFIKSLVLIAVGFQTGAFLDAASATCQHSSIKLNAKIRKVELRPVRSTKRRRCSARYLPGI